MNNVIPMSLAALFTLSALTSACDARSTCDYEGTTYEVGDSFDASDGCNSCSCSADGVGCTDMDCAGCVDGEGIFHDVGASWPSDCNTCTCVKDDSVDCTDLGCLDTGE
jgi:hypothetical protein